MDCLQSGGFIEYDKGALKLISASGGNDCALSYNEANRKIWNR